MCGIAGHIGQQDYLEKSIKSGAYTAMRDSLSLRGPDQNGTAIFENAVLVHTRLSVVDPEHGRQPMTLEFNGEEYAIVYNGEIYNTGELRAELLALGHCFVGHGDTEVILHAYAQWGEKCVSMLNGIFAFAVWEKNAKRLFVARDRIGVKPFFFAKRGRDFVFASEIKALLKSSLIPAEVDQNGLAELLLLGPGRTPGCGVFKGVEELLPAECGYFDFKSGKFIRHRYWALEAKEHKDNFSQTAEKVRFLLTDAIERQLVADVPVCTFLSGGLDSSIIASVAADRFKKDGRTLHTVTVDYADNDKYFQKSKFQPNSDGEYVREMVDYLGSEHHSIVLDTPELARALYTAVDARDLPGMADVDSSLLLFCREIKNIATVALSGECADEIFGGYPWYRDKELREREGFPWAQSTAYRESIIKGGILDGIDAHGYVHSRYEKTVAGAPVLLNESATEKRMKQMMKLNLDWFMQTLLDRKDRMSMYSGLEVRVPFCDYRIAEYLYNVPWEYKDYSGTEKGLLREAMRGILPERVLWRKKSPYPKTHNPSYLAAVSRELQGVINDPASPVLRLLKKDALTELLTRESPVPFYGQLMTTPQTIAYILQLNYWMEKYKVSLV